MPKNLRSIKSRFKKLERTDKAFELYKSEHPNSKLSFEKFQQSYLMLAGTGTSLSKITRVSGAQRNTLWNINKHFKIRTKKEVEAIGREATAYAHSIESNTELVKAVVVDLNKEHAVKNIAKKHEIDILTVMKIRDKHTTISKTQAQRIGRLATTKKRTGVDPAIVKNKLEVRNSKGEYVYSVGEIAEIHGLNKSYVRKESKRVGRTPEDNTKAGLLYRQVKRVGFFTKLKARDRKGNYVYSVSEMATLYGLSKGHVKRLSRKAGRTPGDNTKAGLVYRSRNKHKLSEMDNLFLKGASDVEIASELKGLGITLELVKKIRKQRIEVFKQEMLEGKMKKDLNKPSLRKKK